MKPRPILHAVSHYPGITHLDVIYPDGRRTLFAMDMRTYATAWSRARARNGGLGYVLAYLRRRVGLCVAVRTLSEPSFRRSLTANPGLAFGP